MAKIGEKRVHFKTRVKEKILKRWKETINKNETIQERLENALLNDINIKLKSADIVI